MKKRLLACMFALSATALLLVSCTTKNTSSGGAATSGSDVVSGGETTGAIAATTGAIADTTTGSGIDRVIIATSADILSWDPYRYNETPTNQVMLHIFETLVTLDGNLNIIPGLAETWETSEDGLAWTFHLRQGVKFHDGSEMTSADVLASFEIARDAEAPSAYSSFFSAIGEIEAPDDYTVVMHTTRIHPFVLSDMANVYVLKRENVEGKTEEEIAGVIIGTGKYKMVEHVMEDHIDLALNEDYWGEKPSVANVRFRPITNEATRTATMLSNEAHLTVDVGVHDIARLEQTAGLSIITQPSLRTIYLNLDGWRASTPAIVGRDDNPLQDLRVRQAIWHAIDVNAIIEKIMMGYATPAYSYVGPTFNGYNPELSELEYNPELAIQLLADAGYEDGFTVILDAPNDRYVNDGDVAQSIASYLERVGITVDLALQSRSTFFTHINVRFDNTGFLMTGWSDSTGEGAMLLNDMIHTYDLDKAEGTVNRGYYTNAEVDSLIEQALVETDAEVRAQLVRQADAIALSEVAYIPLYFEQDVFVVSDVIEYTPMPNKYVFAWDITVK